MATPITEAFSISHAAILDGATGLPEEFGDVYGVRSGSLEPDTDSYDNTGDDVILSSWNWLNKATVAIQSGYLSWPMWSLISGAPVTSSGAGASEVFEAPLWTQSQMNTSPRPLLIRCPSKDSAGTIRYFDIVLYRVQFAPITFDGPSYKEGLLVNYNGTALYSNVNEAGDVLTEPTIGRLISSGVV